MIRSLLATLCAVGLMNTVVLADDVVEIVLRPGANPLMYDKTALTAKVGQKIKLTLENKSAIPQPHNFMLLKPGSKDKVIALANMMLTDPNAMTKQYIPESTDILYHTNLIQPGQSGSIEFTVTEPGAYPYLCTFPGHSILMNGVLTVEK